MQVHLDRLPVTLPLGGQLVISGAGEVAIQVLAGRVWITREGAPDDVFVDRGERYRFPGDGRVVVSAEGKTDARIAFDAPLVASTPSSFARWWARLLHWRPLAASHPSAAFEGG